MTKSKWSNDRKPRLGKGWRLISPSKLKRIQIEQYVDRNFPTGGGVKFDYTTKPPKLLNRGQLIKHYIRLEIVKLVNRKDLERNDKINRNH